MLARGFLDSAQFLGVEPEIVGEGNWVEPEVGRQVIPVNMDMRRLINQIVAVEVETVRPDSQHCGHERILLAVLAMCQT